MTDETKTQDNSLATRVQQRTEGQLALREMLMQRDAEGHTVLAIPEELKDKFNVLAPTAVLAQHDPNFTPGFTVVTLDPATDFYVIDKQKWPDVPAEHRELYQRIAAAAKLKSDEAPKYLAPNKVGLRKIMDAVGIIFDGKASGGVYEGEPFEYVVQFGEKSRKVIVQKYRYKAVGRVRKSDGTFAELTAETQFNPPTIMLKLEIAASNTRWINNKPAEQRDGLRLEQVLKGWIQADEYKAPMLKSKAQNALIRDAAKAPQKFTPEEAAKPFFVVSYNFTPDTTDPNIARIVASLVGVEVSDTNALYGAPQQAAAEVVERRPGADEDAEIPAEVLEAEYEIVGAEGEEGEEPGEYVDVDESEAAEVPSFTAPAEEFDGNELKEQLEALGAHKLTITDAKGKTLSEVWEAGGAEWFEKAAAWANANAPLPPKFVDDFAAIIEYLSLRKTAAGGEV